MHIQFRAEIFGQAYRDAAVASAKPPGAHHFGVGFDGGFNGAVAAVDVEEIEASADADATIAGVGVEGAINVGAVYVAVAGMQTDVAVKMVGADAAVTGVKARFAIYV